MKKLICVILGIILSATLPAQNNTAPCTAEEINCPDAFVGGTPNANINFNTNNGACTNLSNKPTLFYKVNITGPGSFTFLIRPGTDLNQNGVVDPNEVSNVDYDWAVWQNTNCNNLAASAPVRISFDAPGPFITGLSTGEAPTDVCEAAFSGNGLLAAIPVNAGDQLLIAVNFFTTGQIPPFQLAIGGQFGGGGAAPFGCCINYDIADKDGNIKNEFCLGEGIFLTGRGARSGNYKLELLPATGTVPLATRDVTYGQLNGANVMTIFPGFNFQTNTEYRVKLTVNGPCGCYEVIKDFHFICCPQSIESEFSLVYGADPKLKGISNTPGTHLWQVYNISQYTGEISSSEVIGTSSLSDINLNIGGPCYYIKHTVSNACGSSCASKRLCFSDCNECNLAVPTGLAMDAGNKMSWQSVPGATSYIIEVYACDPACCGGPPDMASDNYVSIAVPGTSHTLTAADFASLGMAYIPCFAWRVFAQCPNGSKSVGSAYQCGNSTSAGLCSFSPAKSLGVTDKSNKTDGFSADVFPNPSGGSVTINIQSTGGAEYCVSVYDNTGRLIREYEGKRSVDTWRIDSLSKGIYLITITTSDNQVINKKLVIE